MKINLITIENSECILKEFDIQIINKKELYSKESTLSKKDFKIKNEKDLSLEILKTLESLPILKYRTELGIKIKKTLFFDNRRIPKYIFSHKGYDYYFINEDIELFKQYNSILIISRYKTKFNITKPSYFLYYGFRVKSI